MSDKSRAEFEQYAESVAFDMTFDFSYGFYVSAETQFHWETWQASRKAAVVDVSSINVSNFTQEKIRRKLTSAGIGYK